MTIGQVAKKAGVNIETIRYYERRGLIPEPKRRESGYRQYTDEAVRRIRFIKRVQKLGFSLKEIAELLSLRVSPSTTCAEIKSKVESKIAEIDAKIRALRQMKKALKDLSDRCVGGSAPSSDCPILESLEFDN